MSSADINSFTNPSDESQIDYMCPGQDTNSNTINCLQIKDVKAIEYYENTIVATDYNIGLLFWDL